MAGAAAEVARRQGDAWDAVVTARFRARLRATGWRLAGWAGFTLGFLVALVAVIHAAATGSAAARRSRTRRHRRRNPASPRCRWL